MITETFLVKLKILAFISLTVSPFAMLLDKLIEWQELNIGYAVLVLTAVTIDHLLGTLYHAFWLRDFSFKKNVTGLITKLVIVVSIGYLFEGLHTLMESASLLVEYVVTTLRVSVFLYPAGSAFGNAYVMTDKQFPPMGFMEWLKKFAQNSPKYKDADD